MGTLNGLFLAESGVPVAFNGLDLPSGSYVIADCTWQLAKAVVAGSPTIIYNVSVTLQEDLPPQIPLPAAPANPLVSTAIVQKIGW